MPFLNIRTLQDGSGRYSQSVILDGRIYVMNFRFSSRQATWYLDLSDQDAVPIAGCVGRRLVADYPVLRSVDPRRPPGELVLAGGSGTDPGLLDLGSGQILSYADAAELGRSVTHFGPG